MKLLSTALLIVHPLIWGSHSPPPATHSSTKASAPCSTVIACRRALAWQKASRRHLQAQIRVHFRRDVAFAIGLAASIYRIPADKMTRVAMCESRLNPTAQNGQYEGLFQIGPRINSTALAGWNPFDPIVNALAAAQIVTQDGGSWREWTCGNQ